MGAPPVAESSDLSEWQRSVDDAAVLPARKMPGTATGNRWTGPPRAQKKNPRPKSRRFMLALPIFPGSRPPSIVGASELNFCVRDGNRWTLTAINTNYISAAAFAVTFLGDPYRIRTDVNGVRGRCLNHLTNGPLVHLHGLEPGTH